MRNEPPISTSSPRLTSTARPSAKVLSASRTAAAQLLTTAAASAASRRRKADSMCASRLPRPPVVASYSRFE